MKQSIPGTLKRISPAEKNSYIELDIYSKEVCTQAVAFTLTPETDEVPDSLYGSKWERVTYYGDQQSITNIPLHPLEIFLKEYKDTSSVKELEDERDF